MSLPYPAIDPIAFSIGPVAVRWYALAYVAGFMLGIRYVMALASRNAPKPPSPQQIDDFMTWAILGTILGGRLGYVLFYQPDHYLNHPLEALMLWHGGMSFHGGAVGVITALWLYARRIGAPFFAVADLIACGVPIGLGLGRIANFINGELFGRMTEAPWGMVFPRGGDLPRHPSQLYEAGLEGAALFIILALLVRRPTVRARRGTLSGVFLAGYGLFRFLVEFVREPDAQLGFLWGGATMGQLLCLPMMAFGFFLILSPSYTKKPHDAA